MRGESTALPAAGEEGKQQFLSGFLGMLETEGDLLARSSLHLGPVAPVDSVPAIQDAVGLWTVNRILHSPAEQVCPGRASWYPSGGGR